MCAFDECVLQDNDLRMSAASGGAERYGRKEGEQEARERKRDLGREVNQPLWIVIQRRQLSSGLAMMMTTC